MQRPSPGMLLKGLRESLAGTVLPAVTDGAAMRQLKAALHLLGRLERSWDLTQSHLAADNADIEHLLVAQPSIGSAGALEARVARVEVAEPQGFNDPALRKLAARNLALHQLLLDLPDDPALPALYARMAARDAVSVGDKSAVLGQAVSGVAA